MHMCIYKYVGHPNTLYLYYLHTVFYTLPAGLSVNYTLFPIRCLPRTELYTLLPYINYDLSSICCLLWIFPYTSGPICCVLYILSNTFSPIHCPYISSYTLAPIRWIHTDSIPCAPSMSYPLPWTSSLVRWLHLYVRPPNTVLLYAYT